MSGHLLSRARHDREPWGLSLFLRWTWKLVLGPFTRFNRWRRLLRLRRSGVDHTWWWLDSPWFIGVELLIFLLALIFLAWLVRALIVVVDRGPGATSAFGLSLNKVCYQRTAECGALTGWVTSLLSIALASAVFLILRLGRLRRRWLRAARRHPREMVPTAGTMIGKIVGREQLCRVVMEDLRVRRTRRPHVLVGGVGTGKTAVIVRLTELLAKRRAIPVPVRLRDAEKLDFTELARRQFLRELDQRLSSGAEGEKVWRRLLGDGRIVVLADGLEEALADENKDKEGKGDEKPGDRDTEIRNAIRDAHRRRLPLFIASRPHAPLRGTDATIHELEPLSDVDALSYITEDTPSEDDWRLSWIVEMADVAEAPLYLQITRELSDLDLLDDIVRREEQVLQSLTHDKSALRLRLLETWKDALVRGRLYPEVALDMAERELTLDWISALACLGLKNDRLVVGLGEEVPAKVESWIMARQRPEPLVRPGRRGLRGIDKRLAVTWAAQLGLVELGADRVRFEHSLIQAYLGSRLMDLFLTDDGYWRQALGGDNDDEQRRHPRPGREFLIALVLHSRRQIPLRDADKGEVKRFSRREVCQWLRGSASKHSKNSDNKALDIYAAALEIASVPDQPAVRSGGNDTDDVTSLVSIGDEISGHWHEIRSDDLQTLEEAKIGLAQRFGDALRTRSDSARADAVNLGYKQLYEICCQEESYRVRLAGAQEIARGGCAAFRELRDDLDLLRIAERPGHPRGAEPAAAGSVSGRGPWAWQVSAWLVPLLITTVPDCPHREHGHDRRQHAEDAGDRKQPDERQTLESWLGHLPGAGRSRAVSVGRPPISSENAFGQDRQCLSISEEIALAQGLKYAANRRHNQLHTRPDAWSYLEDKALEALRDARYWFSELTLIQALTLWVLPEEGESPGEPHHRHSSTSGQPRANPDETVERWLDIVADKMPAPPHGTSRQVHPFVKAAADMANRALTVQQPGRFLWMDESDVVSRVGAGQPRPAPPSARRPRLWIPPSMGWSALDREAQQLLADVLLLLNLTERGQTPDQAEDRLQQANEHELPPCITADRRPMQPLLTIATAGVDRHDGRCLDGCRFQLCPYPPKGLQHHRTELSEEFCRRQYRLVRRYPRLSRRTARWQGMSAGRLRVFWTQMAERARNSSA